ncbi:telomerase protein component 1-like [Saccostrea cucullata]|uniref:telomerase protein component 1-like n=1 Tax=Saccostrea cuccullata TaxID=36930 RepID=UPI002ED59569
MEALNRQVLEGRLNNLPPEEKTDVVVFVSSTFTDMSIERNYIMNQVTSELNQYCLKRKLAFRFLDMRWGVRDEASVDHTTEEIVLDAVRTAREDSKGPFFLVSRLNNTHKTKATI